MNCSKCETYKRSQGRGTKACLQCKQYKTFQTGSGRRQTVKAEPVSQTVLEQIADNRAMQTLVDILKGVDLQSATIILQSIIGATQAEIAEYNGISRSAVARNKSKAIDRLKRKTKKPK